MKRFELLFLVLAFVLSGCASTGGSGKTFSVKQLKDMGEKYVAAGDTASGLKCLTEAEQKKPGDPMIQYDLGLAYNQRALPDQALSHFQQALKLKPDYPEALNAIGAVYADRGQIELAQEAFQKALADPFYQTPQYAAYNLGKLYERKGDTERALTMYEQAVHLDPAYGLAWYRMATILEQMRRGDEARNAYGKAVSSAPDLAEAHLRYGVMSYQAGNMEAAVFSLSRVVKLAPNTAMADEAASYLGKLKGLAQIDSPAGRSRSVSPTDIEVISNQELQRRQIRQNSSAPRPDVKEQPYVAPKSAAPVTKMIPVPTPVEATPPTSTEGFAPAPREALAPPFPKDDSVSAAAPSELSGEGHGQSPPPPQQFNYIVQLGSFVDKDKADEMKNRLNQKGYNALVKPLQHNVLGRIYVIQLRAVNSSSKASTLMTQISGEVEGEPVMLKVPVAPKPTADLTPQPVETAPKAAQPPDAGTSPGQTPGE